MAKLYYTIERLSKKQSLTPEGYLLCEEVPIARIGAMIYGGTELSNEDGDPVVRPDEDGLVRISREPNEVFRPETIASFNGKSVTDDHPTIGQVTPETWQQLTVGVVQNVRRGLGHQDDLLLADLLITVPDAIEAVRTGKREVSCGYEADYEETGVGEGRQKNIVGNHVALVESGRCGWRCAIGDRKFIQEKQTMSKNKTWLGKVLDAIRNKDEAALEELKENAPTGDVGGEPEDTHIHLHTGGPIGGGSSTKDDGEGEFVTKAEHEEHAQQNQAEHQEFRDSIEEIKKHIGMSGEPANDAKDPEARPDEGNLEEEAPVGTGDKAIKSKDSSYIIDSCNESVALAEILAPGIRVPSFDRAADPKQTFKKLCGFRRQALDLAYAQPATRGMIEDVMGGKPLNTKDMTCDAVRTVFKAVASMKRAQNNGTMSGRGTVGDNHTQQSANRIQSVKDIGKVWEENYGKKN